MLVDTEEYVFHLSRYIHLNPVRVGLVSHPAEWLYSNYVEWTEQRSGSLVDRAFVREYFPTGGDYEAFVMSDVDPSIDESLQVFHLE